MKKISQFFILFCCLCALSACYFEPDFENGRKIRIHGKISPELREPGVWVRFYTRDSACQDFSMATVRFSAAGKVDKMYPLTILDKESGTYEVLIPAELKHPRCDWIFEDIAFTAYHDLTFDPDSPKASFSTLIELVPSRNLLDVGVHNVECKKVRRPRVNSTEPYYYMIKCKTKDDLGLYRELQEAEVNFILDEQLYIEN